MKCKVCQMPLNHKGQCLNEECSECPKCAKHQLPFKIGSKCAKCLEEDRKANEENERLEAAFHANALLNFGTHGSDWLNGQGIRLDMPGNTGNAGETQLRVLARDYPWTKLEGEDRFKKVRFTYTQQHKTARFDLDANGPKKCFFLPWRSDCFFSMKLGPAADLFITAAMNGCCVMIAGPRATPTVFHVNFKEVIPDVNSSDLGTIKQQQNPEYTRQYSAALKLLQQRGLLGEDVTIFDPAFYMALNASNRGVVWGVRDGSNNWTFYYQMDVVTETQEAWKWPVLGVEWGKKGDWTGVKPKKQVSLSNQLWPERKDP
ncbi:MAG: hypothetical protein ACJ8AT_05360 [Hyalangium sp.]|uniref:hypothetical protein n=1 Tax=Hyalangium sp. TaxID=2028555 RepID=UPI00389AA697